MRLIRVEAGGFRSYRELDLDFGECQLIRICGKNGMGKSTIIESLGWTMFGQLRDGGSIQAATHIESRPLRTRWARQANSPSPG